eukprot:TRINITY_DN5340_c0_g1_i1.p1 TRINITY_DN5340_c0_g1~~TRINITY_DN5340_c0_g1_i1.p1  ORF type:complete len:461 (-),score=71.49 TRINITY_DN5340_c0_g1_i1:10-1392(-)
MNGPVMQQALAAYLTCLECFNFSIATKPFKTKVCETAGYPWNKLIAALNSLCICEGYYYKLVWLETSKNRIDELYAQIHTDLKVLLQKNAFSPTDSYNNMNAFNPVIAHGSKGSLSVGSKGNIAIGAIVSNEEASFYISLIQQICTVINVRLEMITVYSMFVAYISNPADYVEISKILNRVLDSFRDKITHHLLYQIKNNIMSEISILKCLVAAQIALSTVSFKDCILLLSQCRLELDGWRDQIRQLQPDQKTQQSKYIHAIHQWLTLFLATLTAKATFYFYPILKKKEEDITSNPNAGRELASRLDPDYISVIDSFTQRTQLSNISLIYESKGGSYCATGYSCVSNEPLTGLGSWPCIFSYPKENAPLQHWPNIISIISANYAKLDQQKEPYVYFYDSKITTTYFISRMEPQITMVLIYEIDRKKPTDPTIWEFIHAIVKAVRNKDIFRLLLMMREVNR